MKNIILSGIFIFASFFSLATFAHEGHEHPVAHLAFSSGVHAHIFWEVEPAVGTPAVMRIEFMNGADHTPATMTSLVQVALWMPSMNHGSAPTLVQPVADGQGGYKTGVYRVSNMYFVMGGGWDVRLTLVDPTDVKETKFFSLELPQDGHGGHHGH